MKTATMILAAGILSVGAAAHAQSSIDSIRPSASPNGVTQTGLSSADYTALIQSMQQTMPKMQGDDLSVLLAQITAKMKAQSEVTSKELDVARTNPTAASPDVLQAKLDALQRLQTQTNASKDILATKLQGSGASTAPAAPAMPAGVTQAQYQLLMRAKEGEASDLQKVLAPLPAITPTFPLGIQGMQRARADQDSVVRPTQQQLQARQQLDNLLKQPVNIRTVQQKDQAMQLMRQSQWQPPATPAVVLTAQQEAQLAAMVTPQHQALLTALSQAQGQLAAARDKQAAAQKRIMTLQSQMVPGPSMVAVVQQIAATQREIIDLNPVIAAAQQRVAVAQQQAAPALQAVSAQAALAAQMRAQRAAMTPAQLAAEKAQQERDALLLRKEQLKAAQTQLPIVQQQLKEAQEQVGIRQKAAEVQLAQLKLDQQKQLETAQANMTRLQQQGASAQQMQAAGQQIGGLQRSQQQQLQGMQQAQYQDQQSQQKHIASLQQLVASLQQQINGLQASVQASAAQTPTVSPEMQKVLDSMQSASTAQIDQIVQQLLAQANSMTAMMQQQRP